MERKNNSKEEFIQRTDILAMQLGVSISAVCEIIDVSPATFFAYRAGRRKVSNKSWKKLELAEIQESSSTKEVHDIQSWHIENAPESHTSTTPKQDIENTIEYVKNNLVKHIKDPAFSNIMIVILRQLVDAVNKMK